VSASGKLPLRGDAPAKLPNEGKVTSNQQRGKNKSGKTRSGSLYLGSPKKEQRENRREERVPFKVLFARRRHRPWRKGNQNELGAFWKISAAQKKGKWGEEISAAVAAKIEKNLTDGRQKRGGRGESARREEEESLAKYLYPQA